MPKKDEFTTIHTAVSPLYYAATFLLSKIDLCLCVIEATFVNTCLVSLQLLHKDAGSRLETCLTPKRY